MNNNHTKIRCAQCSTEVFSTQGRNIVIYATHHGETHTTVIDSLDIVVSSCDSLMDCHNISNDLFDRFDKQSERCYNNDCTLKTEDGSVTE